MLKFMWQNFFSSVYENYSLGYFTLLNPQKVLGQTLIRHPTPNEDRVISQFFFLNWPGSDKYLHLAPHQ